MYVYNFRIICRTNEKQKRRTKMIEKIFNECIKPYINTAMTGEDNCAQDCAFIGYGPRCNLMNVLLENSGGNIKRDKNCKALFEKPVYEINAEKIFKAAIENPAFPIEKTEDGMFKIPNVEEAAKKLSEEKSKKKGGRNETSERLDRK
jgi:hypothetical protein